MVLEFNKKAYRKNLKKRNFDDGYDIRVGRSNPNNVSYVCRNQPCTYYHFALVVDGVAREESEVSHSCKTIHVQEKEEISPFVIVKCTADLFLLQKSILAVDSSASFVIEKDESDVFKRCFVGLSSWANCFKHSRKIIQIDGTFMKSKPKSVLLAAIGIDGRGSIFPISVGVVSCENIDNWTWFLEHVKSLLCASGIDHRDVLFVSDRDKGLLVGLETAFPNVPNFFCTRHLASNLKKRYKDKNSINAFYSCAYEKDKKIFDSELNRMQTMHSDLHAELLALGLENWAISACTRSLYGYGCSNLVESFNGSIVEARKGSIIECIDEVIVRYQEKFYDRFIMEENSPNTITEWIILLMGSYKKKFEGYKSRKVGPTSYYVETSIKRFVVDLNLKECSCLTTARVGYPCSHLYFIIVSCKLKLRDFVSSYYFIEEISKSYADNLPAFEYSSLDCPKESLLPAPELPSRGRPPTKRKKNNMDFISSRARKE